MRIGIDLGGSKIEIIAIDARGQERLRRRIATPQGDYDGTVRAIAALVALVESEIGCHASVGIGMPGTLATASGLVKNANSTCLNGRPLDRDLEAALQRPVRLANDANCLAQSEAVDGAGAGFRSVFAVILGTGGRRRPLPRRPCAGGLQRHRRGMGAQPASRSRRCGASGSGLLLRPARLHRDLPVRPRLRTRSCRRRRAPT